MTQIIDIDSATLAAQGAEATIQPTQAQPCHLPMVQTTGKQTEQNAGTQRPGNQQAILRMGLHGPNLSLTLQAIQKAVCRRSTTSGDRS